MNRRELMGLIACTIVGEPMAATAQQVDKPRRVAVLMDLAENDPEGQARLTQSIGMVQYWKSDS
jgi:putative ABC transport system substrate-binding protein